MIVQNINTGCKSCLEEDHVSCEYTDCLARVWKAIEPWHFPPTSRYKVITHFSYLTALEERILSFLIARPTWMIGPEQVLQCGCKFSFNVGPATENCTFRKQ